MKGGWQLLLAARWDLAVKALNLRAALTGTNN